MGIFKQNNDLFNYQKYTFIYLPCHTTPEYTEEGAGAAIPSYLQVTRVGVDFIAIICLDQRDSILSSDTLIDSSILKQA